MQKSNRSSVARRQSAADLARAMARHAKVPKAKVERWLKSKRFDEQWSAFRLLIRHYAK